MRKYDFTPIDLGEQMDASKDDFDAATETMTTIMPLLYQSGYITIKNYDPETELYTLALPNKEVRIGLYRSMLPHYLAAKSAMCNTTVAKMSALINKGNMDGALQLLKTFWETVPYCDNTDYEGIISRQCISSLPCLRISVYWWNSILSGEEQTLRWKQRIPSM